MEDSMKTCVVMAVHNGQEYLKEQLSSLERQTRAPDRLIVVDDCSEDSSAKILDEFRQNTKILMEIFTTPKNIGHAAAFEIGLAKAYEDLIFLCDQDDVWFPEKISEITTLALNNPSILAFTNDVTVTDANLKTILPSLTRELKFIWPRLSESYFLGCASAIRQSLITLALPFPDGLRTHDRWILQFSEGLETRMIVENSLQFWRRHNSNASYFNFGRRFPTARYYLMQLRKPRSQKEFLEELKELEFLRGRLVVIDENGPLGEYKEESIIFAKTLEKKINFVNQRIELRKLNRTSRLFYICSMIIRRRYEANNPWRTAIADLFSHGNQKLR